MGNIYDKGFNSKPTENDTPKTGKENVKDNDLDDAIPVPAEVAEKLEVANVPDGNEIPQEAKSFEGKSKYALALVNDVVLKNYVTKLESMEVVPIDEIQRKDKIIMHKINKMVYEKDEYATDKFFSVIGSMTNTNNSVFLIVDGQKDHTDFYIGIKSLDDESTESYDSEALISSLNGQFPGLETSNLSDTSTGETLKPQDKILQKVSEANCISSYVGVPALKNSKGDYTNATFVQGLEKFATAMQGKEYTAIILASNNSQEEIQSMRNAYESIYTQLSAMATQQLSYSTNESMANAFSRTSGYSDSTGRTTTIGTSDSHTENESTSIGRNWSDGFSHENKWAHVSKALGGVTMALGTALTATGIGAPAGIALMGLGAASFATGLKAGVKSHNEGGSETYNSGTADAHSENRSVADQTTHSDQFSTTDGQTATIGQSKNFTITIQNKHYQDAMKRIDKQLERLELCEGTGLWSTGAYFISYDSDRATAKMASSIFRSIMQGEQSGVEVSALNSWTSDNKDNFDYVKRYVAGLEHPQFKYYNPLLNGETVLSSTSALNSKEVAMMVTLPRKSVPGLPVSEHISLAKEVVRLDRNDNNNGLLLGNLYDQGHVYEGNAVQLDIKSLTQHMFVTGSTGCGKSNTIYYLIDKIKRTGNAPNFLVIEPAKGEYKNVFGDEYVYGTNPLLTDLLRINPFAFPKGVHVLEHIDRLIEIFNVCWPMYAAMPAVLKEATLSAYENSGWDLCKSKNKYSDELFPNFQDLLNALVYAIENSAYSDEVKSNYAGSLITRVKSLTNGINKDIFTSNEIGDKALFDKNVIVDLSRVGSQETKSLIMGILIMRLTEYRANQEIESNGNLRHITILEEAHNILKRCSTEQDMEGANVAGKSVEMISNAIAEMRTYGEGFVIVDQSPSSVDISAIKNTNTKIIMRLPEESDRRVAGKSAAMKDNQLDEIAKLPTGVAVVYQNNWEDPVLCKIGKFAGSANHYNFTTSDSTEESCNTTIIEALQLILCGRVEECPKPDRMKLEEVKKQIVSTKIPTFCKTAIIEAIEEYNSDSSVSTCSIWRDIHFDRLAFVVSSILDIMSEVITLSDKCSDFSELSKGLVELIHKKLNDCPVVLDNELCHCLMHAYGSQNEVAKRIYNAWYSFYKNQNV